MQRFLPVIYIFFLDNVFEDQMGKEHKNQKGFI